MFAGGIFRHGFLTALLFLCLVTSSLSEELQSLMKLKSFLQSSNESVFSSWTEANSPCHFTGIVCNSNGFVSEINLAQKQLVGTLPFDSICKLQSLEKISLGSNNLHGSISEELVNCTNLKHLDLGVNSFNGPVPDLSPLNKLEYLNLNASGISGSFPWKSLENLTSLTFLSLGDNILDKSPFPLEVLRLEKLYWLYLTNCSITGNIPLGIGNLTQLINLELSDNYLSGEIPADIGKLQRLWQLELYDNSLSGKIPVGFGNLTNLVNFDASSNQLEGDLSELRSLTSLASLQLFWNHFSGEIPKELGDIKNLTELSLYGNNLTGPLPQKLGSWIGMEFIDVSDNSLSGPIPPYMCKNNQITDLALMNNSFNGTIPETYASCTSLLRFPLSRNSLSGVVPSGIWGLPNLELLDLSMNSFEGPVTSDIAKAKSLAQLFLSENRFSGELPVEISEAVSLVSIQLSSNQISGHIPETIGQLKKLTSLTLNENNLSGIIPDSIGSCTSLNQINLAGNSFSGSIPASIGSLPTINSLNLSSNRLSGEIPPTLSSLRLSLLDLSNNQLFGSIPESLAISAFKDGFKGNPGLCSQTLKNVRSCSLESSSTRRLKNFVVCFISVLVILLVASCFLFTKLRQNKFKKPLKTNSWNVKQYHVINFSENEIIDDIKAENLIGKGGSGNVYKVVLKSGEEFAVKHIWTSNPSDQGSFRSTSAMLRRGSISPEYDAEVATLSSIRHVNVVKLYCSITSEDSSLLVYEFLPNGSLWDRLHTCKKTQMGWEVRYDIAMGAARGLEYLHHGCDRPVIHRDVKSSNILLDEEWKPRIADFGLARIVQGEAGNWTHVIAGTLGYMPPEYAYTCKVTEKSDVYSFGVVLMELVTGKRPIEPEFGENKDIVFWVCSNIRSKENALELVDPALAKHFKEDAMKVLRIATLCTAKIPASRPSMRMLVQMLEDADPFTTAKMIVTIDG
ncbi:receptor-like protein kinase 7 [Abrus precatorius]|uniref:non-specific serine/threonine protein kinase n=1 Tax=Abrus precatorius TaxID=3816 RepID=A0A8B8K4E8_ABRPR|nr:receptor-like protein kinase 7 [Abrus precatorius]